MGGLAGRESDCAKIDRLLEAARGGASGSLVVRGEPGIGKTALLAYAADHADTMTVLRCTGVEGESDLVFAGLYGLVRPILGHLGEVADRQSAALAGALGLAPSAGSDRFLVSAALLSLLAAAAEARPVVCVVDDAQWLDTPSTGALVFTARRLGAERIAMLFGAREGDPRRFDAPGLQELVLTGLDDGPAAALLARYARGAAASVRERLLTEAAGNPLALLELPAGLSPGQLAGQDPLPDALPLTGRLQAAFEQRIAQLPEAAQMALLIAAADGTGEAGAVLGAAAQLGLPPDALDPAEKAGLVQIPAGTMVFRHPLVRSALLDAATLHQRQRAHTALAAVLTGDEHADRRVWHQAMATLTADEEVAAALEASARRSQIRAAHSSAVTAFTRAAELSTDPERRASRLAAGAHAAWAAGEPVRARGLIEQALPITSGQPRARLLFLSGVIEARCGDIRAALRILHECLDAASDPSLTLEALGEVAETAAFAGDFATAAGLGRRAATVAPGTDRDRFLAAVLTGLSAAMTGDHARARSALGDVVTQAERLDDPRALIWAASAAWAAPELADGLGYANQAVALARQSGMVNMLPLALQHQATALLDRDRFDLALTAAEEGYRLALDTGQTWGTSWHLATMALVEAVWGRREEARDHAGQVLALGRNRQAPYLIGIAEWRLGLLHLTEGRPDQATGHLLAATAADNPESHPMIALRAIPDAVEAAVRAGRQHEITTRFARYQEWVSRSSTSEHSALCSRSRALLEPDRAGEHYRQALGAAALPPFWRARTELLYGQWLRRARRRQEARGHLRAAVDLFHQLRAMPWEDRAAAELRATGETTRARGLSAPDQLTPQEQHIAWLVADGLTNAEIAARLFLSPRTIDYHLRKVFTKLGIASRTELARRVFPQRTMD
jgi:DNA-binding CsgD family transcriptional regulator